MNIQKEIEDIYNNYLQDKNITLLKYRYENIRNKNIYFDIERIERIYNLKKNKEVLCPSCHSFEKVDTFKFHNHKCLNRIISNLIYEYEGEEKRKKRGREYMKYYMRERRQKLKKIKVEEI